MPQANHPIYLDHHATTPVDPRVLGVMLPYFGEKFGNAASVNHVYGWEAAEAVEAARQKIADLLQADARSLVFTSGATESNNLAIKGVLQAAPPQSHVITTAAEHRSVLDPLRHLARRGTEVTFLNVDSDARVTPDGVARAIRPNTVLVSVIWANNEVGSLNPIREIGELCRERGILFHTDAVPALGKLPVDLSTLPVDLLSGSAHKLYGPKGVGLLYLRRGGPRIAIEPLVHGGGHEQRLRSGTLPVPLIVGFGEACRIAAQEMPAETTRLAALRDHLWQGLSSQLDGLILNGHPSERLAGNLNVSFEGVDGEALMTGISGIAVSSGSACTSADPEPSHVLRAMGRSDSLTRASLRFGLGRSTT
ncbi:MAG TPA: cysteine desulfurase family protein, partial [Planctomycetaceae bacterium]|nr:cysteine desulfurase family protein [Planctomycetaceae bacterium]